MPVTMSGVASGINSDKIIQDLIKVERKPIFQLEQRKRVNRNRIKALRKLEDHLKELNRAARDLYGFNASYNEKKALSSDTAVLAAKANKIAEKGIHKIKVDKVASTHKISSDPISEKTKLPSGKFKIEVNGESYSIRFKGGRLSRLKDKIDEEAGKSVGTSYIRTTGNKHILTLQSKTSGKKGEMKLSGDKTLLKAAGIVGKNAGDQQNKMDLIFDKRYFTQYIGDQKIGNQNGNLDIGKDGKSVKLKGLIWQEYILPVEASVKDDTTFEFNFSYKKSKEAVDNENIPRRIEFGPDEKVNIKGIELNGYNISRIRKKERVEKKRKFNSLLGVGIVVKENGKRIEKVFPVEKDAKGKQEIPIGKYFSGKKVSKIILYCNDGSSSFSQAKIITPVKTKGLLQPKNVIAKAEDAKLRVNGIKVTRDKNIGLNDVIKGVTIDLKRASRQPVEINVSPDLEKAIEKIKKFVKAYNKYLSFHRFLVKADRTSKPGDYGSDKRKRRKNGLFMGDMTMVSLENNVRRTVNGAYPNMADKPIKIFAQIGVSTGKIRSNWQKVKEGKLVIEESVLKKVIIENPEGVRMFFGSDSDGDRRPDTGMAFTLVNNLRPYIRAGKNIIATKIDLENDSIKLADERIDRKKQHLKKYEETLRRKFSAMEKAISGSNATKNWMKNQFGGGGGGNQYNK